jgi:predicted phage terminase large subunit-like protein
LRAVLANPETGLRELDRFEAEARLSDFIHLAWHVLEPPSRDFVPGWHIAAICEHLEAISDGEITRLLINIPPGCMKSLTTSVFWPAWEWGPRDMAHLRYIAASYAQELSLRDNLRCRRLIDSSWYRGLWGKRVSLRDDQNAKAKYENTRTGYRLATSVGGIATGERGDRFIIDDPHNIRDGESEAKREATLKWFSEVVPTRLNDPATSAIVVVMQRVHDRDVSGLILARELGYEHLMLPMEFEPERRCTTAIGFTDPRSEAGELLWPERMTKEVVERDKRVMGSYAVAGQFQQRPAPREGGLFKRHWFELVAALPSGCRFVRHWDLAGTRKTAGNDPAWTAGVKLARAPDGTFYIAEVLRLRGEGHEVRRAISATASRDGPHVRISLPQDPGQAGKVQAQDMVRMLAGYRVQARPETGDKLTRAEPVAAQAEAGNLKLLRGAWNEDFLEEASVFPNASHKDQIDALSGAFAVLQAEQERWFE